MTDSDFEKLVSEIKRLQKMANEGNIGARAALRYFWINRGFYANA